eukprot:GFKZ01010239.1.p1 GENE.GFKZ01010239.1~~GFKZ01010239.1.p1  ORF type:complete len:284 (-),score=2.54 GFKZ01010239.1:673-1416(-)
MHFPLSLHLLLLLFLSPPIQAASLHNSALRMFLTGENCTSSNDCASGRSCLSSSGNKFDECDPPKPCFCFPNEPDVCDSATQCPSGEICATTRLDDDPICVAITLLTTDPANVTPIQSIPPRNFSPSPSPSPASNICIDARLLSHLPAHQLVFPSNNPAVVLCDANGSCATPGHMVVWRAQSMMMRTYCNQLSIRCLQLVMPVNSPRWLPRRRVKSHTEGLQFTAFAARYHTDWEEALLRRLVHAGL